jgi:hypothetical protein
MLSCHAAVERELAPDDSIWGERPWYLCPRSGDELARLVALLVAFAIVRVHARDECGNRV